MKLDGIVRIVLAAGVIGAGAQAASAGGSCDEFPGGYDECFRYCFNWCVNDIQCDSEACALMCDEHCTIWLGCP